MGGLDVVRAIVRWVHAIAAVSWVGGGIFYLVVLRPALVSAAVSNKALETAISKGFRDVVDISIIALIVTGVVITFDRLSSAPISTLYFIVLGLKLAAVLGMLFMARDLGTRLGRILRGGRPLKPDAMAEGSLKESAAQTGLLRRWLSPSRMVLVLGLVAFFLSMVLVMVFERNTGGV